MSPKPGDMGHPRLWKLISERLVGEGCGFPCLQNRETWGTRDCGSLFQKDSWGKGVVSHVSKIGRHGAPEIVDVSERLVGEGCGLPCLQNRETWGTGDCGSLFQKDSWGKGVVSHVSKTGRHGAPEIVEAYFRKTRGGRVWSPMSPNRETRGTLGRASVSQVDQQVRGRRFTAFSGGGRR
jgi:hypothetical protein